MDGIFTDLDQIRKGLKIFEARNAYLYRHGPEKALTILHKRYKTMAHETSLERAHA
jgi:hypothetical protein